MAHTYFIEDLYKDINYIGRPGEWFLTSRSFILCLWPLLVAPRVLRQRYLLVT